MNKAVELSLFDNWRSNILSARLTCKSQQEIRRRLLDVMRVW